MWLVISQYIVFVCCANLYVIVYVLPNLMPVAIFYAIIAID